MPACSRGRAQRSGPAHDTQQRGAALVEQLDEDVVLTLEVLIQGRARHDVGGGNVPDGGLVEADPAAMARTVDSISERNRQAEARHRCPTCQAASS